MSSSVTKFSDSFPGFCHLFPVFATFTEIAKMPEPQQSSWADEIEEGDISSLPAPSEKYIGDSEKIVTTWSFNDDGKKVKKVSTYKIEKKTVSKVRKAPETF